MGHKADMPPPMEFTPTKPLPPLRMKKMSNEEHEALVSPSTSVLTTTSNTM